MIAYKDGYDLLDNAELQKRVKYARLRSATFILIEAANTPNHAERVAWAEKAMRDQLQMSFRELMLTVILDAALQQDGLLVTDVALQGAVDAAIPRMIAGG